MQRGADEWDGSAGCIEKGQTKMSEKDDEKIYNFMSKAESLRAYEDPLGKELGAFADSAVELITELFGRVQVLEGNWNPSKRPAPAPKEFSLKSPPTDSAKTSGSSCYVLAREVLPEFYWNKAPQFLSFLRVLYSLENGGESLGTGDAKPAIVYAKTKGELKAGTGLLQAWEWGMQWGSEISKDRHIRHWLGAVYWEIKRQIRGDGASKKAAELLRNNGELRAYIGRAVDRFPTGPIGSYHIASGIVDWCDRAGHFKA